MPEETKTNQTSEPNMPVTPDNKKINEAEKRKETEKSHRKTDDTRKSGYDENGKLDNPKIEEESSE